MLWRILPALFFFGLGVCVGVFFSHPNMRNMWRALQGSHRLRWREVPKDDPRRGDNGGEQ